MPVHADFPKAKLYDIVSCYLAGLTFSGNHQSRTQVCAARGLCDDDSIQAWTALRSGSNLTVRLVARQEVGSGQDTTVQAGTFDSSGMNRNN